MISTTTIGSKEEPYPMIANVWDFFAQRGRKTVFVSVGTGKTCLPDLDFAETIGCTLLKLDTPEKVVQDWMEVKEILKTRKATETTSEFAKGATRKWVLPKNITIERCLPSLMNGMIETLEGTVPTKRWFDIVSEHCKTIGLSEDETHIDVLKLDTCDHQDSILFSLWQTGFRPSLVLVNWNQSPDSDLNTLLSAGHLQMLGYCLAAKEGNRFLYYYTDTNYYETCSWETPAKRFENPLISNLLKAACAETETAGVVHFPLDKKE
jgi:hypothetical protein